jgi:hypothetical protein
MSAEILVGLAGIVLSVLFEYFPGLSDWYDKLQDNYQRLLMLGMLVVVAGVVFAMNCEGWFAGKIPVIECSEAGVEELVWLFIIALGSNQTTHRILPK